MEALVVLSVCSFAGGIWAWLKVSGGQEFSRLLDETVDAFRMEEGEEGEVLFERLQEYLVQNASHRQKHRVLAAHRLMYAGAPECALQLVEDAVAVEPDHARALRLKAILRTRTLRGDGVILLTSWVREHPDDREALLELGETLLKLRRTEEMRRWLVPYLRTCPEDIRMTSLLGRSFFYEERFFEAREHLTRALALRKRQKKRVISMYEISHESGFNFHAAVEEEWEEARERLLLEQIASAQEGAHPRGI